LLIGKLRKKIVIERNTNTTPDSNGQVKPNWETLFTRYAYIRPLKGREYEQAHQMKSIETHEIGLRYVDITPRDRFRYGTRIFNIESVLNIDEKDRELICRCKEEI